MAPKFKEQHDEKVPATKDGVKKSALDEAWDYEKTYVAVIVLLVSVAAVACWAPARRAASVDPV